MKPNFEYKDTDKIYIIGSTNTKKNYDIVINKQNFKIIKNLIIKKLEKNILLVLDIELNNLLGNTNIKEKIIWKYDLFLVNFQNLIVVCTKKIAFQVEEQCKKDPKYILKINEDNFANKFLDQILPIIVEDLYVSIYYSKMKKFENILEAFKNIDKVKKNFEITKGIFSEIIADVLIVSNLIFTKGNLKQAIIPFIREKDITKIKIILENYLEDFNNLKSLTIDFSSITNQLNDLNNKTKPDIIFESIFKKNIIKNFSNIKFIYLMHYCYRFLFLKMTQDVVLLKHNEFDLRHDYISMDFNQGNLKNLAQKMPHIENNQIFIIDPAIELILFELVFAQENKEYTSKPKTENIIKNLHGNVDNNLIQHENNSNHYEKKCDLTATFVKIFLENSDVKGKLYTNIEKIDCVEYVKNYIDKFYNDLKSIIDFDNSYVFLIKKCYI